MTNFHVCQLAHASPPLDYPTRPSLALTCHPATRSRPQLLPPPSLALTCHPATHIRVMSSQSPEWTRRRGKWRGGSKTNEKQGGGRKTRRRKRRGGSTKSGSKTNSAARAHMQCVTPCPPSPTMMMLHKRMPLRPSSSPPTSSPTMPHTCTSLMPSSSPPTSSKAAFLTAMGAKSTT